MTPAPLRRLVLALLLLACAPSGLRGGERGPTTPAERSRIQLLARASEQNLRSGTTEEDRGWFLKVAVEVPDIHLEVGDVAMWGMDAFPEDLRPLALFQYMLSASAFQVENPGRALDVEASDVAGLAGVVRAWQALARKVPDLRSPSMEEAGALLAKGDLAKLVRRIRADKAKQGK